MAISLREFAETLRHASAELRGALLQELVNTALRAESEAKLRVTAGGATRLNVRTGRLRASIAGDVKVEGDAILVRVSAGGNSPHPRQLSPTGTNTPGEVRYAAIHEYGGTIRPSRRQFLTIPVHDSLRTGAGVARFASARDVPGLQYAETSGGQRLLIHEDSGEVFYLLRRSVTLPPRPYLNPAIRTAAGHMNQDVLRAMRKLLVFSPSGVTVRT